MNRRFAGLGAAVALFLAAGSAFSQMDEPHGYIEPCTIANYQEMMTECDLCTVPHGDPEACSKRLKRRGYEKKCRTRGEAASYGEVWCVAKRPAPARSGEPASKAVLTGLIAALLAGGFLAMRWGQSDDR